MIDRSIPMDVYDCPNCGQKFTKRQDICEVCGQLIYHSIGQSIEKGFVVRCNKCGDKHAGIGIIMIFLAILIDSLFIVVAIGAGDPGLLSGGIIFTLILLPVGILSLKGRLHWDSGGTE